MPSSILLQSGAAGAFVLLFILTFVVMVAMVVWTYTDAQENSTQPAWLWAIVVFLAPLLGLVLYSLLGRDAR